MSDDLLKQVTSLITDKDFQALSSRCVATTLFEKIKLDENKKSDILAWLLSPHEGHQQGDYFVRALINAVYSNAEVEQLLNYPCASDVLQMSFNSLQIMRELTVEWEGKYKYIDLFLIDPYQELVIVIERKDGSLAKNDQLFNYADWVNVNYASWDHIFVLSDSYDLNHKKQYDNRYIQLDDTWLTDALLDLIGRGKVTPYQETQFRDIHDYIFGQWREEHDDYYRGFDKRLKQVAESHCEILRALEKYSIDINDELFKLLDINQQTYYSKLLPNINEITYEDSELLALTQRFYHVFEQLHGLNEFDEFEDKLLNYNSQLYTDLHADHIWFVLKQHKPESGEWPFSFQVKRVICEQEEKGYELNLFISKYVHEEYHLFAEQVALTFGKKFKKNQKLISIKQLVLVDELDLSIDSKLTKEINTSLNKISALVC